MFGASKQMLGEVTAVGWKDMMSCLRQRSGHSRKRRQNLACVDVDVEKGVELRKIITRN